MKSPIRKMRNELIQAGHGSLVKYIGVWMSYRTVKLRNECPLYMTVDGFLSILPALEAYMTERAKDPIRKRENEIRKMRNELIQAGHGSLVKYIGVWMSYRTVKLRNECPLYMTVDGFLSILPALEAYMTERDRLSAKLRRREEAAKRREELKAERKAVLEAIKAAQEEGNLISTCRAAAKFMGISRYEFEKLNIEPDFKQITRCGGVRFHYTKDTLQKAKNSI